MGQSVKDLCVQLLEKLSRVAESPYGQGVIAHMLLRGDERDIMAGTLGLILLEKYITYIVQCMYMYTKLMYTYTCTWKFCKN